MSDEREWTIVRATDWTEGRVFSGPVIELVYLVMGADAYLELLEAFDRDGIQCRPEREPFELGRHREMAAAS